MEEAKNEKPKDGVSRRAFLSGAGFAGAALAAGSALSLSGCGTGTGPAPTDGDVASFSKELDYPGPAAAPSKTSYESDVLVIGAGWAGLHAAITAAKAGKSVVVVDKGKPGYSGCCPFSHSTTYYDSKYDNKKGTLRALQQTSEYLANLDSFEHYMDNSKKAHQENVDWGMVQPVKSAKSSGYSDYSQDKEYFQKVVAEQDRHLFWMKALEDNKVTVADHVMAVDLVETDGKVTGAIGFHYKSSTMVSFAAKSVVLCTGPGNIKPAGFVNSGNTFDGEYMAYQHGLTIVGKEFDDFHQTNSYAPGDFYYNDTWDYVEPFYPIVSFGVQNDAKTAAGYASGKGNYMILSRINQTLTGLPANDGTGVKVSYGSAGNPKDPRTAYTTSLGTMGKDRKSDCYGAAPGMNTHMCCGVYCGWDDHNGKTSLPGLYVAGDGTYGAMEEGAVYTFTGTTSNGCSVQGDLAGAAAAAYAGKVSKITPVPATKVAAAKKEIFAPSERKSGFDPNWCVDQLQAVMISPRVHINRSEATLKGALAEVEYLRDHVIPNLMAYTGHDMRIAVEAKHKVLSAEMKLRAQLERQESRGMHYRSDFPYRDDEKFLCHLGVYKDSKGKVAVKKIAVPDSWKGDLSASYTERYVWRFPGEAKAKGIPEAKSTTEK